MCYILFFLSFNNNENINEAKEMFIEELQESIKQLSDNMLYEDFIDEEEIIVRDIFEVLNKKEKINREDLLEVYENHNNYIDLQIVLKGTCHHRKVCRNLYVIFQLPMLIFFHKPY